MYISQSTYDKLNDLLQKSFQMNSFCDNLAYNMSMLNMVNTEPVFHKNFAHKFPEFADVISDMMVKLDAKPVRQGLKDNLDDYNSFEEIFADLKEQNDIYRVNIIDVIESADLNEDLEVKIIIEKFLCDFITYLHQVNVWHKKSKEYGRIEDFDQDFTSFTFI